MATLDLSFRSKSLNFYTRVKIYLPEKITADTPVLYLLHGMYGDCDSWVNGSAVGRYAMARNMAVIMPSVENSFYCNMKYGPGYYDYVAKELPEYLCGLLSLSEEREKNFIAGLSMGGYGAFKIALRNPERYAAAASLSGCLNIAATVSKRKWGNIAESIWGSDYATSLIGTEDDIMHLVDNFPSDKPKPALYFCCGTEDGLHNDCSVMISHLEGKGFDYKFEDGPGGHNWLFWDTWIESAMDHMLGSVGE